MIVLYVLLFLLAAGLLFRVWRTGEMGFGPAAVRRADDPTRFRFETAINLLLLPSCAWLIWAEAVARPSDLPAANPILIYLGLTPAFWFFRALGRGNAVLGELTFDRAEEPLQYWLLTAATGTGALLLIG